MAEVLTNEEIDAQIAADEARRIASAHLASQGVPGYSAMPPQMSPASAPPPAAPPTSSTWDKAVAGAKQGVAQTAGMNLGGPAGAFAAGAATKPPSSAPAVAPPPEASEPEPSGPPMAPASTEDAPLILNRSGGGAGRVVMPGGMYPESMTTQVHEGRAVPGESKQAFAGSTALQLEGAQKQADADRGYYEHVRDTQAQRMRATEDAQVQHARVQAERDAMVKKRIADIEALNAQASAEIDPNKFWHDRGAGAHALGAIAIGLGELGSRLSGGGRNTALDIIESGINQEIQAQIQNRQLAGQKASRAQTLLDLHLSRLGDQDKAIDATKMALWDNVAMQLDAFKSNHAAQISEANLLNMQAGILEKRGELVNKIGLQEADDINKQATQKWHNPVMAGGAAGSPAGKMDGYELVPVPASDQTSEKGKYIAVPKDTHAKLAEKVGATNVLIGINSDALKRLEQIRKDRAIVLGGKADLAERTEAVKRITANRDHLTDLANKKASYLSTDEGQGVNRDPEFARAMKDRVHFNDYWTTGDGIIKRIQAQNNALAGATGRMIQGAGGQEVRMAYTKDKNGALQPTPLFTGKPYAPPPVMPEADEVKDPRKAGK
jgi:hypothetical protein